MFGQLCMLVDEPEVLEPDVVVDVELDVAA